MEQIAITKLFKNGNSQAVRLPKSFRFEGDEVVAYRQAGKVILAPKSGRWDDFFSNPQCASSDFMIERVDTPPQPRKIF